MYNEQNSGSTFKQWNKGISLASGEYVWIAESDDVAELTFLERMVDCLVDHPDAGLAYCQSCHIDQEGRRAWESLWIRGWTRHSGLLPARIHSSEKLHADHKYNSQRKCGADAQKRVSTGSVGSRKYEASWGLGVLDPVMLRTNVCYVAETLNYFRTHSQSVRIKILKEVF